MRILGIVALCAALGGCVTQDDPSPAVAYQRTISADVATKAILANRSTMWKDPYSSGMRAVANRILDDDRL